MTEQIKPVAYLYKIRGGVSHQTIEFSSLTDDDTCWQNRDDGEYELLSASPLYSAETVQQLQQRNDRLFAALKDVVNPLEKWRRELEEGSEINGMAAMQLLKDPEIYREIARNAIIAEAEKAQ